MRPLLIVDTPPTPNGDLHVGHLAGPFVNADVYARYQRALGRDVLLSTGTDDSQTYVLASARRRGLDPGDLAARSAAGIRRTLADMGMSLDGFAPYDDGYRSTVLDFVGALHAAGRFRARTVRLPYSQRRGEFLVEGLVGGWCPVCLVDSRGGLCETCGHPNNFDELVAPHSTVDGDDRITTREATILVLPMEEYRERLTAYYDERAGRLRPHTLQLVREVLSRPLPDFPVTYPLGWGIPAPFAETPGQVLNAWVEGIPAVMYCSAVAAANRGRPLARADELWRKEHDAEVVYFIGFDNVYFWGLTHLALLMAHDGRYVLPDTIVSNEFYELDNDKFSTSLGHVVYSRDLLPEVPCDLIRFYLAVTNPEHQRMNFSRAALDTVTRRRLVEPWNELSRVLAKLVVEVGADRLPVPADARAHGAAVLDRLRICYELPTYSLTRAADLIVAQLDRLLRTATALSQVDGEQVGGLLHQVRVLVCAAAPILIDLAAVTARAGAFELSFDPPAHTDLAPFALPLLGTDTGQPTDPTDEG